MLLKNSGANLFLFPMSEDDTTTVQVENLGSYLAELKSSLSGQPPYTIHGVAIGPDNVTHGLSGDKKLWPASTLQDAAASLQGKNLVIDHENSVRSVVGEVTDSHYRGGIGVVFEAELDDREIAEKVQNNRLDVSARIFHRDTEELSKDEATGAYVIDLAKFDNLSFVMKPGASSSNSVEIGKAEALRSERYE